LVGEARQIISGRVAGLIATKASAVYVDDPSKTTFGS